MQRRGGLQLACLALAVMLAAAGCRPPNGAVGDTGPDKAGSVSAKRPTGTPATGGPTGRDPKNAVLEPPGSGGKTGGQQGGTSGTGGTGTGLVSGGNGQAGVGLGLPLDAPVPLRVVPPESPAASLIGKVKLITDKSGGIISNNTASVIGDAGTGLISNNGGGIIANNGGGLIGKTKYMLFQAGMNEALLTDATVEVFDAAGNRLVDANNKPITARTDANGNYALNATLPAENLVLRIRLADDVAPGGELRAFLTKDANGQRTVDIDTASTFGSTYVLEKYVKGNHQLYQKLPGSEDAALRRDMEAARAKLAGPPSYKASETIQTVETLRSKDASLDTTLVRIEKLLTIGQSNLGTGLAATSVALSVPVALAAAPDGGFYVGEAILGRVRHVDPQGTIRTYVAPDGGTITEAFGAIDDMVTGPDGLLYVLEPRSRRIRRIGLNNQLEPVAGNSQLPHEGKADGVKATEAAIDPTCMAFAPDGTLFIAEAATVIGDPIGTPGRVFERGRDFALKRIPNTEAFWQNRQARGLAVASDGALWVCASPRKDGPTDVTGAVMRRAPGGAWAIVKQGLNLGLAAAIAATPDGGVWLSEDKGNRIWKLAADGTATPVAGTGAAGYAGDGGPATQAKLSQPSGLWRAADGSLHFTDFGNSLVRKIAPDGTISTVAGTTGGAQQGDASRISINSPSGVAMNAAGELFFSETGSHTIKKFDGKELTLVAGTDRGYAGDGGPATAARLTEPTGLAFSGDTLYVADHGNHRIRKIVAGTISTVAGKGKDSTPLLTASPMDAQANIGASGGITVGPDGLPYWTTMTHHRVLRLNAQGQVEVFAGALSSDTENPKPGDGGDGGPARQAQFSNPNGLAFDAQGNMYVADTFNFRVRKIDKSGVVSNFAGSPAQMSALTILSGEVPATDGVQATSAVLAIPGSIAVGPDGSVYIGELGTKHFGALGIFPQAPVAVPNSISARVRRVKPDGTIWTIAGPGGKVLNGKDGEEPLGVPIGLVVDKQGRLVIVDTANNQVRIVPAEVLGN